MKLKFCLLFLVLLIGCAHNSTYKYSGYQRDFISGIYCYHQYERVDTYNIEGKEVIRSSPFLANENEYLSDSITKLRVGVFIENPQRQKIKAWANQEIISLEKDKTNIKLKNIIPIKGSVTEFISFDMPFQTNIRAQVFFSVDIELDGKIIYSTSSAQYKIGGK